MTHPIERPWQEYPTEHLKALAVYLADLAEIAEGKERQSAIWSDRVALSYELEIRRLRETLRTIGTECANYTQAPFCPDSGRTRDGADSVSRWYDQCIAREGLNGGD